jgi:hypothetical protein
VIGFVEMIGRQGTIESRYDSVKEGMSRDEALRMLGPPDDFEAPYYRWLDGAGYVTVRFDEHDHVAEKEIVFLTRDDTFWWHSRRLAEEAWTAIHRPRLSAPFKRHYGHAKPVEHAPIEMDFIRDDDPAPPPDKAQFTGPPKR